MRARSSTRGVSPDFFTEIGVEKDKKGSRRMSIARPSTKLRSIERHQPSPPLSQRKGEGKRLVLIAAGPAESIFVKSTFSSMAPRVMFPLVGWSSVIGICWLFPRCGSTPMHPFPCGRVMGCPIATGRNICRLLASLVKVATISRSRISR